VAYAQAQAGLATMNVAVSRTSRLTASSMIATSTGDYMRLATGA
jgi:hypothetical protein